MHIKINLERTQDGFSAYAENYNIFAVGKDINEITSKIHEALNLYFEEQDQKISLPSIKLETDSTENPL